MSQLINIGAAADDGTGDDGRVAFDKVNRAMVESMRYVGWAGEEEWAGAGDSMEGYAAASGWGALMAVLRMLHYDYNFTIATNGYYDADSEVVKPIGQRGNSFGKGGTTVSHMRNVQLPFMLQAKADGAKFTKVFISAFQNDRFGSLAAAKAVLADFLYCLDALQAVGVDAFCLGVWPQTDLIVNGTANAYGKHFIERALTIEAQNRPGFVYVPMLEKLKTGIAAEEAQGKVNYKPGFSYDGIHAISGLCRALAPYVAPYIRKIAAPRPVPTFDALPFDQTKNPLGNIMGAPGRFGGSGGTITDLSKAAGASDRTVASANVPAGVDLQYDTTKGITLTPRLTGDPDEPYEVELSGTPTTDGSFLPAVLSTSAVFNPGAPVRMWGQIRLIDVEGTAGEGAGGVTFPVPIEVGIGGPADVIAGSRNEVITFSTMTSAFYRNEYGSTGRLGVTINVKAGVPIKGRIRFRRLGMFRISAG